MAGVAGAEAYEYHSGTLFGHDLWRDKHPPVSVSHIFTNSWKPIFNVLKNCICICGKPTLSKCNPPDGFRCKS